MFAVEVYATVRQLVFNEGKSRREVARLLGLSRDTVGKMCRFSAPPGYVRSKPVVRPKLGPLIGIIDAILERDRTAPPKQRHTAKRVFERLRDEHGFAGGYTTVRDYVREARTRQKETFVPLSHPPGHAGRHRFPGHPAQSRNPIGRRGQHPAYPARGRVHGAPLRRLGRDRPRQSRGAPSHYAGARY